MASNLNPPCPIFIYIVEKDCGFGNCKLLSQEHKADIDFKALHSSKCGGVNLE